MEASNGHSGFANLACLRARIVAKSAGEECGEMLSPLPAPMMTDKRADICGCETTANCNRSVRRSGRTIDPRPAGSLAG